MRKLPFVLAAATLMAVMASTQIGYAATARQWQVQRTPSAEILRVHASAQLSIQQALEQPTLPDAAPGTVVRWRV
jgi:hypothetical protein